MEREPNMEKFEITVNKPTADDVEDIEEVFYQGWMATYPNKDVGVTKEDIEERFKDRDSRLEHRRKQIESPKENNHMVVARHEGRIIGVCGVVEHEGRNQLRAIYVLPEYWGKGVGTKLWEEAKAFLNPRKETTVELVDYNTQAKEFYERHGFKDTGRRFQDDRFQMKSGAHFTEMEMKREAEEKE